MSGKLGSKKGGSPEEEYQKQKEYLSKFPVAFQKIINEGKVPGQNLQIVYTAFPSKPITSKKELYDYLYDKMRNIEYWCDALDIPVNNELSGIARLNQIIMKLNEFDQSNTPSNSILLQKIEQNRKRYPNFYK